MMYSFRILLIALCALDNLFAHRTRRFLTFPRTQPTSVQIISGIGIPVDLEVESVTIGYVFKAQFFLPENATNFLNPLNDPFELTTQPISGTNRKIRSVNDDSTDVPAYGMNYVDQNDVRVRTDDDEVFDKGIWIEQDIPHNRNSRALKVNTKHLKTSRFSIYNAIAAVFDSKGLSGKACLLKSICEAAHTPFDYSNGILGEMMHVILSPSATTDDVLDYSDYEFYKAETLGRNGSPCERIFEECKTSILEQFTGVYSPIVEDLLDHIIN